MGRAGHATILSRQRDHVSRPQSCLLLQYNYIWCSYSICRHRDLNIFLVPEALLRCREAIKLLRAQLWMWAQYPHIRWFPGQPPVYKYYMPYSVVYLLQKSRPISDFRVPLKWTTFVFPTYLLYCTILDGRWRSTVATVYSMSVLHCQYISLGYRYNQCCGSSSFWPESG